MLMNIARYKLPAHAIQLSLLLQKLPQQFLRSPLRNPCFAVHLACVARNLQLVVEFPLVAAFDKVRVLIAISLQGGHVARLAEGLPRLTNISRLKITIIIAAADVFVYHSLTRTTACERTRRGSRTVASVRHRGKNEMNTCACR